MFLSFSCLQNSEPIFLSFFRSKKSTFFLICTSELGPRAVRFVFCFWFSNKRKLEHALDRSEFKKINHIFQNFRHSARAMREYKEIRSVLPSLGIVHLLAHQKMPDDLPTLLTDPHHFGVKRACPPSPNELVNGRSLHSLHVLCGKSVLVQAWSWRNKPTVSLLSHTFFWQVFFVQM